MDSGVVRALRALSNPMRLRLLQWLREPSQHFAPEHVVEAGVCVSHIQAKAGLAQSTVSAYLTTPFNIAKFKRLGYTDDDIDHGGSDRIVDDLVFWGSLDTIVNQLRGHLDAGADHVAIQVIGAQDSLPHWRILADALRGGR